MAIAGGCFAKPGSLEHAEHIVHQATGDFGYSQRLVAALKALGLLQLEAEPIPVVHHVPCLPNGIVDIREDTLIETLRMAGYEVAKRRNPVRDA